MEPTNDPELRSLLREWQAPALPASLEDRVLRRQESWWRFLLRGYIRVPIPVACCVTILIAFGSWRLVRPGSSGHCTAASLDRDTAAVHSGPAQAGRKLPAPPVETSDVACAADSHC
jgi:hypothetical protein